MTSKFIIRPVRAHEHEQLTELAYSSKAHWGYSNEFMEACREELSTCIKDVENPRRSYFAADMNGDVLGYYSLEKISESRYELEHLFVEPEYIGKGLGRALIEHAKSFARSKGASSIIIQGDPNAVEFYKAAGGMEIGERESDSIPGRYLPEFMIYL